MSGVRPGFCFALAMFGLVFCASAVLAQEGTGSASDFLTQYDAADPQGRQILEMFIAGQERGLLTANQYLRVVKSKIALYCPPDDTAMTPPQLVESIRNLVRGDSRTADIPLAVVILMVLQRNYPCPPPPNH